MAHHARLALPAAAAALLLVCGLAADLAASAGSVGPDGLRGASKEASADSLFIRGTVHDLQTGAAVPGARVRLEAVAPEDPDLWVEAMTDGDGAFSTTRPLPMGTYRLLVEALGYGPVEEEIRVLGAGFVELRVTMAVAAVELEPVVAVSRRAPRLARVGFYERRDQGWGYTFTWEELQGLGFSRTTDIFRHVSGARVYPSGQAAYLSAPIVRFRQGGCAPEVFLDGVPVRAVGSGDVMLDDVIMPSDIQGIEVYPGMAGGSPFGGSPCGTIVIWSRDPGVVDGRPFAMRTAAILLGLVTLSILFGP